MGIEQLQEIEIFLADNRNATFKATDLRNLLGMNYNTIVSHLNYLVAKNIVIKNKKTYRYGGKL